MCWVIFEKGGAELGREIEMVRARTETEPYEFL